jgi:hypothetical protein
MDDCSVLTFAMLLEVEGQFVEHPVACWHSANRGGGLDRGELIKRAVPLTVNPAASDALSPRPARGLPPRRTGRQRRREGLTRCAGVDVGTGDELASHGVEEGADVDQSLSHTESNQLTPPAMRSSSQPHHQSCISGTESESMDGQPP